MFRNTFIARRALAVLAPDSAALPGTLVGSMVMLLKTHPIVTSMHLENETLVNDVAQCATHCVVGSHVGMEKRDVIVMCPNTLDDVAALVERIPESVRQNPNPKAQPHYVVVHDTDVNALVPCVVKALGQNTDPRRVLGCPTLHTMRARVLLAAAVGKNPFDIDVSVCGGASPATAVPLFAPFEHHFGFGTEISDKLSQATAMQPTIATYGGAYAATELVIALLKGLRGDPAVSECVYMTHTQQEGEDELFGGHEDLQYFCRRVAIGKSGVEQYVPLGTLSQLEKELLAKALPTVKEDIQRGLAFEAPKIKE
eukprot:PhM_4_TR8994/c0_g1_i1/m.3525/K00026/MDH2; malate dehydrogenase